MVERFNQTIENQLSKYVEDHQRDWDKHIPFLLMAYRTAVHEATGHSPSELMLGRHLRLPVDLVLERPEEESPYLTTSYADCLLRNLENAHQFARKNLKLASDKMKERYDISTQGKILECGDAVWLFNPQRKKGVTPKLARNWKGPYVVIKRINDVVYRIQLGPRTKPRVVHRNRLWRYGGQSSPTWFTEKQTTVPSDTHDNAGGETNCTTTTSNGADRREPSHLIEGNNKSHSDEQYNSCAKQRSTHRRKPPERYSQNSL